MKKLSSFLQGFNYQAVACNSDNAILANAALDVKIGLFIVGVSRLPDCNQ